MALYRYVGPQGQLRALCLVPAVAKLPDDGEAVLLEALLGLLILGRGSAVEQIQVVCAVPDTVAQNFDGAALGDLVLQTGRKLALRWAVRVQRQRLGHIRLRVA